MVRLFAILAVGLLLGCADHTSVGKEPRDTQGTAMSARTRAILDSLKAGNLSTIHWSHVHVEYGVDSVTDGWQSSFRCRSTDTAGGFDVTFLFPGAGEHNVTKRMVESHGSRLRMCTVANDLFNEQDTMDITIYYTELDTTSDFLRPANDRNYLLIYTTPMNWVGNMVSEWQFVQLVSFDEGYVYELAIPA